MLSPTALSDTILDALTHRYGSDIEAEVFTDERANQVLHLKFTEGDRYAVRIEAKEAPADDPSRHQEFADPHTGAHARITAEALMIFTDCEVPKAARAERGRAYMLYPLHKIFMVKSVELPAGQTAVYMAVAGEEQGPDLTFTDQHTAESFERTLKDAIGQP